MYQCTLYKSYRYGRLYIDTRDIYWRAFHATDRRRRRMNAHHLVFKWAANTWHSLQSYKYGHVIPGAVYIPFIKVILQLTSVTASPQKRPQWLVHIVCTNIDTKYEMYNTIFFFSYLLRQWIRLCFQKPLRFQHRVTKTHTIEIPRARREYWPRIDHTCAFIRQSSHHEREFVNINRHWANSTKYVIILAPSTPRVPLQWPSISMSRPHIPTSQKSIWHK